MNSDSLTTELTETVWKTGPKDPHLTPLQERRKQQRLSFFFTIAKGLVPAIPADRFLTPVTSKRLVRAQQTGRITPPALSSTRQEIVAIASVWTQPGQLYTRTLFFPYERRPDMTFAIDWALNNNDLSIPTNSCGLE